MSFIKFINNIFEDLYIKPFIHENDFVNFWEFPEYILHKIGQTYPDIVKEFNKY